MTTSIVPATITAPSLGVSMIQVQVHIDPALLAAPLPTTKLVDSNDPRLSTTTATVVTIPINAPSPISELKRSLAAKTGIPAHLQRIVPINALDSLQFPPLVLLTKRATRAENFNLTIRTYCETNPNEVWRLSVSDEDTVLDVKFLLSSLIKVAPEFQRLYAFKRHQRQRSPLTDALTLQQEGLTSGCELRILFEFPSGNPTHGSIHRSRIVLKESIDPSVRTIAQLWRRAATMHGPKNFLGTRTWKNDGTRGVYQWQTFAQVNERINNFASGLVSLGLNRNDSVGIMSVNRSEWIITDFACACQSLISVPLYDTLGHDAVQFILNHSQVKVVVVAKAHVDAIASVRDQCPSLRAIVLMDDQKIDKEFVKNGGKGFTHTMSQIEAIGASKRVGDNLPNPNDIYSICYTSGTTGQPKGAILTHKSTVAAVVNGDESFPNDSMNAADILFSYLPLAHIYERTNEVFALVRGVSVGFSQGDTLKLVDDVSELRPTIFPGVPRVWQRMYDRINSQVQSSNIISKNLFGHALKSKYSQLERGVDTTTTLWDKLVFNKVAAKFGGRLRLMISGAAPISPAVAEFVHVAFQAAMIEGYGLTETNAGMTVTPLDSPSFGRSVGVPSAAVEIKLVDVPDMGYLHTDLPCPRGEVWVRGHSVFGGYYRQPDITAECLTDDGWFMTGDVGQWLPDGSLKIIDRKKNLFKLSQGEYIRPEHIESTYKQSKLVANIYVHGDSTQNFLVAIVVPDWENLHALGYHIKDKAKLLTDAKLIAVIQQSMAEQAKRERLKGFEQVRRVVLIGEDFSVENGLLTPTLKVKRQQVAVKYRDAINAMYSAKDEPNTSKIPAKL